MKRSLLFEALQMKFPRPLLGIGKLPHQNDTDAREIMQVQNIFKEVRVLSKNLKKETYRKNTGK
jgi:hypothetical protein